MSVVVNVIRWGLIVLVVSGFGTAAICLFLSEFGHHDHEGDHR